MDIYKHTPSQSVFKHVSFYAIWHWPWKPHIPLNQWKVGNAQRNPNPDEMQNWHCHPNYNHKPIQSQMQRSLNPRKDRIIKIKNSIVNITDYQLTVFVSPLFPPPLQLLKHTTKKTHISIYVIWRVSGKSLWSLCTSIPINQVNHNPKNTSRPQASAATISSKFGVSTTCEGQWFLWNWGTRDQWLHVCKWYQLADIAIEVNCR